MRAKCVAAIAAGVSIMLGVPVMAQDFTPGTTTITIPDEWSITEKWTGYYNADTGNNAVRYAISADDLEGDTAEDYLEFYSSMILGGTIENGVRYDTTVNNMPTVVLEYDDTENDLPVHCLLGMLVNGQESIHVTATVDAGTAEEEYVQQYLDVLASARGAGQAMPETKLNASEFFGNGASTSVNYTIEYGDLVDANPYGGGDGKTLVIKAKISPSYSNKATIDQNYYNIEDLIKNQGATTAKYNAISYWAVADMTDGSEGKVISFDVPSNVMDAIQNGTIVANQIGNYVDGLWVLPSLLK